MTSGNARAAPPPAAPGPPAAATRRRERIHAAVSDGLSRWQAAGGRQGTAGVAPADIRRPLPRRPTLPAGARSFAPPLRQRIRPRASAFAALRRVTVWLYGAFLYAVGDLGDRLRGRACEERRAVRLRGVLERLGGTFLKLGQQLSIRIDLLPVTYCSELAKLLDQVPPFPAEQAIAAVERVTGRPLGETFTAFDPEPIGSASVACVYQAERLNGERVAVKVRRPGIERLFAADWRALSWLVQLAELLALIRPGQLGPLVRDLQAMFLEELDFRREARSTDLFRRQAQRSRLRFLSAPRVHFDLSGDDVMVTELVSGVWLWELLGAVENDDQQALAYLASRAIDPKVVARRLFEASLFGIFDNVLFHADPHPANVVVRPGGEIVLIDFGSCGSYNESQLNVIRQFHYCQANEDAGGMVQCVLALLEPLPPVDVDEMAREVEEVFTDSLQAIRSPHSQWWERTSASIWLGFLRLARRYQVRVNLDILRLIRSTLLYDTLAARLWGQLDIYAEYQLYRKRMARRARRRFRRRVRRLLTRGPDDRAFLRLEEMADLGERLTYRLHRFTDVPQFKFAALAGKAVFATTALVRWTVTTLLVGAAAALGVGLFGLLGGRPPAAETAIESVAGSPWFLGFAGLLFLATVRRILYRLADREV